MNPGFLHSRPEDEIQRGRVLSLKCCYRLTGDYYLFEGIAIVAVTYCPTVFIVSSTCVNFLKLPIIRKLGDTNICLPIHVHRKQLTLFVS
jgi:hypothetical protein